MTAPNYWKMCPNFWLGEIQFNQSQAWTWSHLRASHCLWSNERPGICYLLIFPEPEVRTHLPTIRVCHGAQIHPWCQPDIFFLLVFSMTRRAGRTMGHYGGITLVPVTMRANKCHQCHHGCANKDNVSFSWVK